MQKLALPPAIACFLLAASLLFASFFAVAACDVTEKQLLGSWTHTAGQGFFEDIEFALDGNIRSFSSWLHQGPEIVDAGWSLRDCRLTIDNKEDKKLSFSFFVALNKGQLELREDKNGRVAQYKRIP